MALGPGQHTLEVEARSLDLGVVEHLFSGTLNHLVQGNLGHTGPQVGKHCVTGVHQVVHRGRAHFLTILHGRHTNFGGQLAPFLVHRRQRLDEFLQLLVFRVFLAEQMHLLGEAFQGFALGHQNLAAQQIQRLNTGGAFIDHADTGVTNVLLHAPLGDKAVTTKDLHTKVRCLVTDFGEERLGNRCQEAQRLIGRLALFFGLAAVNNVCLLRSQVNQGTGAFCNRLLCQQHPTNVRVNNDRIGNTFRILRTAQ